MEDRLFGDISAKILACIDIDSFYARYIPGFNRKKENLCPFHVEQTPSFKVFDDGGFKCKSAACGKQGAGPVQFYKEINGMSSYFDAQRALYSEYVQSLIPEGTIDLCRANLKRADYKRLRKERGYTEAVLDHFKIGFTEEGHRLAIPVQDEYGFFPTMVVYNVFGNMNGDGNPYPKVQPMIAGMPMGRLWPLPVVTDSDEVFLCEGYGDTIAALSAHLPACTAGGSSQKISLLDLPYLRGKKIYIAFDADEAGRAGARKIAEQIIYHKVTKKVKILDLGDGDLTEYLLANEAGAIKALMEDTDWHEGAAPTLLSTTLALEQFTEDSDELPFIPLREIGNTSNQHKPLRTEGVIVGKSPSMVGFPCEIHMKCTRPKKKCAGKGCVLDCFGNHTTVHVPRNDPKLLTMASAGNKALCTILKDSLGIPRHCTTEVAVIKHFPAYRALVAEPPDSQAGVKMGSPLQLYAYILSEDLDDNKPYTFEGYASVHPKDGACVGMFTSAIPSDTGLDTFEVTDKVREVLDAFRQPEEPLWDYLMRYYDHVSRSITHIRGRPMAHMAADLVFFSPVSFWFGGQFVRRASLDVVLFGDTRCGKNCIAEGLMNYYEHGEIVSGENISVMNLVGGIMINDKYKGPMWGRLVARNRDTVIVDEMSALPIEDIGRLSRIRSEGMAEIDKNGYHVKATALTGLLWLSNPRDNRTVAERNSCIDLLLELAGRPEDVARWDYAHAVAVEDVPTEMINVPDDVEQHKFTREQYHKLIMWIKSRKPEQITFSEGAAELIYTASTDLSERYSPKGCLIQGANIRIKLAKIAAAIAAKVWSADETGEKLVVGTQHVQVASNFLDAIYKDFPMGYRTFSEAQRKLTTVDEPLLDRSIKTAALSANIDPMDIIELFQTYDHVTKSHLSDLLKLDLYSLPDLMFALHKGRAVLQKYRHLVKTAPFHAYLGERARNGFPPV